MLLHCITTVKLSLWSRQLGDSDRFHHIKHIFYFYIFNFVAFFLHLQRQNGHSHTFFFFHFNDLSNSWMNLKKKHTKRICGIAWVPKCIFDWIKRMRKETRKWRKCRSIAFYLNENEMPQFIYCFLMWWTFITISPTHHTTPNDCEQYYDEKKQHPEYLYTIKYSTL